MSSGVFTRISCGYEIGAPPILGTQMHKFGDIENLGGDKVGENEHLLSTFYMLGAMPFYIQSSYFCIKFVL